MRSCGSLKARQLVEKTVRATTRASVTINIRSRQTTSGRLKSFAASAALAWVPASRNDHTTTLVLPTKKQQSAINRPSWDCQNSRAGNGKSRQKTQAGNKDRSTPCVDSFIHHPLTSSGWTGQTCGSAAKRSVSATPRHWCPAWNRDTIAGFAASGSLGDAWFIYRGGHEARVLAPP